MAVLSDDTLSDDDALGARHGGGLPFVFGWANNMARWGQQDLDDTDAAVADAYNGSASFGYLAQQRAGQPAWLLERAVRVPRAEVATPAPSMADAAFRAALVGDVFGYRGLRAREILSPRRPPDAAQVRHGTRALNRRGPHVPTVFARADRPRYHPHQPTQEHDRGRCQALPEAHQSLGLDLGRRIYYLARLALLNART